MHSALANNSSKINELVEEYSEKCGYLAIDILTGMTTGGFIAQGACHAINSCVTLLPPTQTPSSDLLSTIRNTGVFVTLAGASSMASIIYHNTATAKTVSTFSKLSFVETFIRSCLEPDPIYTVIKISATVAKISKLTTCSKILMIGAPVALATTGLGLLYAWYSYTPDQVMRPPLFEESTTVGASIAMSALGGIKMAYDHYKRTSLTERMNDIHHSCINIILNRMIHENKDLEIVFINKIHSEGYVKNWSSESFQLNNQKFEEFNLINEDIFEIELK